MRTISTSVRRSLPSPRSELLVIALLACAAAAAAAAPRREEVPAALRQWLDHDGKQFRLYKRLSPAVLHGDFDGDGVQDLAALVSCAGKRGIVVLFGGQPPRPAVVLGAGNRFNDMDDLDFTRWSRYAKRWRITRGVGEGPPPHPRGDSISIEWEESASAIVYWNGRRFVWYQQGD